MELTKRVKKLTREQFIAQFRYEVRMGPESKKWLEFDCYYEGVKVYRACGLLLIKIDKTGSGVEKFYGT